MPDKRTSLTPVIVGVVIAMIGILTGLYIADNARSQLADSQKQENVVDEQDAADELQEPAPTLLAPDELPAVIDDPLPPVVSDPLPIEEHQAEEQEQTAPEEELPVEIDDFEEVPLEEQQAVSVEPADTI